MRVCITTISEEATNEETTVILMLQLQPNLSNNMIKNSASQGNKQRNEISLSRGPGIFFGLGKISCKLLVKLRSLYEPRFPHPQKTEELHQQQFHRSLTRINRKYQNHNFLLNCKNKNTRQIQLQLYSCLLFILL